jgi:hypothetical protein
LVSGILRIVKGDKGTAGTVVAPAGEFKPWTSAKVRFEFAMNIYTEPCAPATETATDIAPQAQSWRDTLPIHPAAAKGAARKGSAFFRHARVKGNGCTVL